MSSSFFKFIDNSNDNSVLNINKNSFVVETKSHFINDVSLNKNVDISGTIKMSKGEITFKDEKLRFHNGDYNWVEFGSNKTDLISSDDKLSSKLLIGDDVFFDTPNELTDAGFLFWTNFDKYYTYIYSKNLFKIDEIKDPGEYSEDKKKVREYIFNLPDQIRLPNPTNISYDNTTQTISWNYDNNNNIDFVPSGFLLEYTLKNDTNLIKKYIELKLTDLIINTSNKNYKYINFNKNVKTIKIYVITSLGKSVNSSELIVN